MRANQSNSKKLWSGLREILPNKKINDISRTFTIDDKDVTDANIIANSFNSFYGNITNDLLSNFQDGDDQDPCSYLNQCSSTFSFSRISPDFVFREIAGLDPRKSSGLDNIDGKLFKLAAPVITLPLTHILNLSISTGSIPQAWKMAKVIPIFKAGNRKMLNNYRPISILPLVSKILEKAVHSQLLPYLTTNNLLSPNQSGFRPGYSTLAAVAHAHDNWLHHINNGNLVGSLFIDLQKAFDTVNHSILLRKLPFYGLSSSVVGWLSSYLSGRTQQVCYKSTLSSVNPITSGIPQGSILGPLLFSLYINDLPRCLEHCSIDMYADDTLIYCGDKNTELIENRLNLDVRNMTKWLQANKLILNPQKTEVMLLGTAQKLKKSNPLKILISGQTIQQVHSHKHLGVVIDSKLNFSEHVTKVCNKINSSISVLTRTRKFVNQSTAFLLYNALVLPHIDYCCMVWGAKPTLVTKIQKLQNRALRVVLKLSPLSPTNQIFGTLNTMTVSQRIRFQLGCQAFRAGIGVAPDYLCQKLNRIQPGNRPTTRAVSQGNFVVPKPRCELFKNSFSYRASEFLNSIPLAIRSGPYSSFRRLLKENRI